MKKIFLLGMVAGLLASCQSKRMGIPSKVH